MTEMNENDTAQDLAAEDEMVAEGAPSEPNPEAQ